MGPRTNDEDGGAVPRGWTRMVRRWLGVGTLMMIVGGVLRLTGSWTSPPPGESTVQAEPMPAPSEGVSGSLVICGGGMIPSGIRDRFVELAGGPSARILIVPTASAYYRAGQSRPDYILMGWRDYQVASLEIFHTTSRAQADDPDFVRPLAEATGVWFGGGAQENLTAAYRGTEVERQLAALLDRGGVIGGTSAGAAVMSRVMIVGGREEAALDEGFGWLPEVVFDQHFLKRNRLRRLLGVVQRHPDLVGIGIDEQTALVVDRATRRIQVLGESFAIACIAEPDSEEGPRGPSDASTHSTRLEVLRPSDDLDLSALREASGRTIISESSLALP